MLPLFGIFCFVFLLFLCFAFSSKGSETKLFFFASAAFFHTFFSPPCKTNTLLFLLDFFFLLNLILLPPTRRRKILPPGEGKNILIRITLRNSEDFHIPTRSSAASSRGSIFASRQIFSDTRKTCTFSSFIESEFWHESHCSSAPPAASSSSQIAAEKFSPP